VAALAHFDAILFLFFNRTLSNAAFDAVFPVITDGRFWIIPGIAAALVFLWFQKRKGVVVLALMLATVSVSDPVCNRIVKQLVVRLRPCDERAHLDGRFLIGRKQSRSFPSSHATNMFAQATLLSLFWRRKWISAVAFSFAALIGFSRIYVGVHYPFDVAAGAALGILVGATVYGVFLFVKNRKSRGQLHKLKPDAVP